MSDELGERVVEPSGGRHGPDGLLDSASTIDEVSLRRLRAQLVSRVDEVEVHVERMNERHTLERVVREASESLLEPAPFVGRRRRDLDALLTRDDALQLGGA